MKTADIIAQGLIDVVKGIDPQIANTIAQQIAERFRGRDPQLASDREGLRPTAQIVSAMRQLLAQVPEEQRAAVLETLSKMSADDEEEKPEDEERQPPVAKSKAKPGSFTALVAEHARQWNDPRGFTNSFTTEPPTEFFSKQRIADEAAEREQIEKDDDTHPFRPSPARQPARRMRITHIGK